MSLRKPLIVTPARLRANRQNALKSTGPRTPAGKARAKQNALKHGREARPARDNLLRLGEAPEEYDRILAESLESYPPANPLQRMLVEDLARLRWERLRTQRAKDGKLLLRLQGLERQRRRWMLDMDRASDVPQEQVLEVGLKGAPDSPAKFRELLEFLELLDQAVRRGDFTPEVADLFQAVWGNKPTLRGAQIVNLFHEIMERGGLKYEHGSAEEEGSREEGENSGEETGPESAQEDGAAEESEAPPLSPEEEKEAEEEENLYAGLKVALLEEQRDAMEAFQLYLSQHIDLSRAAQDACLAPVEDGEWRLLMRWENMIDRQIERKIRLYLLLQQTDRKKIGAKRGKKRSFLGNEATK